MKVSKCFVISQQNGMLQRRRIHTFRAAGPADYQIAAEQYVASRKRRIFQALSRSGITVFVATSVRLDLGLAIGSSTQTVTVDAAASPTTLSVLLR